MTGHERDPDGIYTIFLERGYGRSLGNMIELLCGRDDPNDEPDWIKVREVEPGRFDVVGDSMTVKDGDWVTQATALGFMSWAEDVADEDEGSDEAQCFGMSSKLRYGDVEMTPESFSAPSIEALVEALSRVSIGAWCPGDI